MDYVFVEDPTNMKWVFNFKLRQYVQKPDIKLIKRPNLREDKQ